ncbi:MAG: Ycf66 family protein, partial [Synechococcales cyanobacterium]
MLAYILALAVGLGSLALYLGAFLVPELHRKNDFIWSGVGLFYALVLWVCAQRITGGVLLGQAASVALLGWFAWQVVLLRRQLLPIERRSLVLNIEGWQDYLEQLSHGKQSQKVIQIIQTFVGSLSRVLSPKEPPLPPVIDGSTPPFVVPLNWCKELLQGVRQLWSK